MRYILGIDLGTGSMKGLIIDEMANIVDSYSIKYPTFHSQKGYSEQRPLDWLGAFDKIINYFNKNILNFKENLEGISFSGQMHSLVLLDENQKILRNSILWNDVRTSKEVDYLKNKYGELIISETKNIPLEGFTLPKLLWVKNNEPDIWKKIEYILLPKDYLRLYLTNDYSMDYSDASGTLLLNLNDKDWSEQILDILELKKNKMPHLVESTQYIGNISKTIADRLNINKNVKIFAGGADNACSSLGVGIIDKNIGMLSIGTSGVILGLSDDSLLDKKSHNFYHILRDTKYSMGVTLSAGSSLDWIKEKLCEDISYEELFNLVKESDIGSNGLIFTPFLIGERTPYNDSSIRGAFIGLDISHNKSDMLRAVVEGITFSLYSCYKSIGADYKSIVSIGGGAKNEVWLQIQADIFGKDIHKISIEEGPAFGAAIIASVGLHKFKDFSEALTVGIKTEKIIKPNMILHSKYEKIYKIYSEIYENTSYLSKKILEIK
ncbi:xylulokinase [Eremococcus coleocola]|uniref:xylulokinase n=1 Tax=Eremococcus coleocola TaxID=88132 RepID=UPI00041DF742|nr:xylulokinase [Eremococcus coleocola]